MMRMAANRAGMHFRRKKRQKHVEEEKPLNQDEGASQAQRIVRELYHRYDKQLKRWRDYRSLFCFLGFVALFLAILYEQRQSAVAFEVYSTIDSVVTPTDTSIQDNGAIYTWLNNLLTNVWQDPVCGDGLCEAPFEFASYSRFGCRADCGKLSDVQNLTSIQIDIYWDFSHPVGSIPSADLTQQASWNLCPNNIPYSTACYYDSDNTFSSLSGANSVVLTDAPDGQWDLIVRQDTFNKVRGAVRDSTLLALAAYYYKIYVAAAAAIAEQTFERFLLRTANTLIEKGFINYVDTVINASYPNATEFNFNRTQAFHSLYLCVDKGYSNGTTGVNATSATVNAFMAPLPDPRAISNYSAANFLGNSSSPAQLWSYFVATGRMGRYTNNFTTFVPYASMSDSAIMLQDPSVAGSVPPYPLAWAPVVANGTQVGRQEFAITPANVTYFQNNWCRDANVLLSSWASQYVQAVQAQLADRRLGSAGKITQRTVATNKLRNFMILNMPELVAPAFTIPRGTVAYQDPVNARLDALQPLYVDSWKYQSVPPTAALNMTRRLVYASNVTLMDLRARLLARLVEIDDQAADTANIPIPAFLPAYQNYTFINTTVGAVFNLFNTSGATPNVDPTVPASTPAFVPQAATPGLKALLVDYNLVAWRGNTTAYLRCDLGDRGPEYVGQCVAMNNSCVATTIDTAPYNCTDLATSAPITGNLSMASYRLTCEIPCDRRADCNTVCDCFDSCDNTREYCECAACTNTCSVDTTGAVTCVPTNFNAAADQQFISISSIATDALQMQMVLADVGSQAPAALTAASRRLLQDNVTAQLSNVINTLNSVRNQQDIITSQMNTLRSQVDTANTLATQRANDNKLIDLITAGRADIAAGQARVEAKLDVIIGKQNQALDAANKALAVLNKIASLQDKQIAAQKSLETAVTTQLSAIRVAAVSRVITITQALSLWKRARRDRALTFKAAKLANIPCNTLPYADNNFVLDNGNIVDNTTSRERNVGLTNRVIGGLMLHQVRSNATKCDSSKFSKIDTMCSGSATLKPFGVDPVFKRGTTSYDPDYDDASATQVLNFYDCTTLKKPTYNISYLNQSANPAPYCAELYNTQRLPWAFKPFSLRGKEEGFPVWFDINLSQDQAQTWFTWVQEGLYLDSLTRSLTAELVTYNAPLRIFGYHRSTWSYGEGGSIEITHRLNTVRLELYQTEQEKVVFAFTIILTGVIGAMMLYTLWQAARTQRTEGNFLLFFASGWNVLDFVSNALLSTCMVLWWIYVRTYADKFDMSIRYNVYKDLRTTANFLDLADNGRGMTAANNDITSLRELNDFLNWYFALNGINILLLIARVLKLMDFQPRLGVVTRSLWLAGPDLLHFAVVAGMVFVAYSMMAHLIFGNAIEKFASFGVSVNTCFELLLGNIDVNTELRALGGLQSVAGALFFWTYELLVFMVLLNFLLAIIVDAFSEVKEQTQETVGIHTELYTLLRDKWRGLLGRFSPNYIDDDKLGALLRQWAGEDDKKEVVKKKPIRLINIFQDELDETEVKKILDDAISEAPPQVPQTSQAPRFIQRLMPKKKKEVDLSDAQVQQTAKYLVDRFGDFTDEYDDVEVETKKLDDEGEENGVQAGMAALDKDRDQLAQALERLAEVQRELAEGQRSLMAGQKQLAEQQSKLVQLMNESPPA